MINPSQKYQHQLQKYNLNQSLLNLDQMVFRIRLPKSDYYLREFDQESSSTPIEIIYKKTQPQKIPQPKIQPCPFSSALDSSTIVNRVQDFSHSNKQKSDAIFKNFQHTQPEQVSHKEFFPMLKKKEGKEQPTGFHKQINMLLRKRRGRKSREDLSKIKQLYYCFCNQVFKSYNGLYIHLSRIHNLTKKETTQKKVIDGNFTKRIAVLNKNYKPTPQKRSFAQKGIQTQDDNAIQKIQMQNNNTIHSFLKDQLELSITQHLIKDNMIKSLKDQLAMIRELLLQKEEYLDKQTLFLLKLLFLIPKDEPVFQDKSKLGFHHISCSKLHQSIQQSSENILLEKIVQEAHDRNEEHLQKQEVSQLHQKPMVQSVNPPQKTHHINTSQSFEEGEGFVEAQKLQIFKKYAK